MTGGSACVITGTDMAALRLPQVSPSCLHATRQRCDLSRGQDGAEVKTLDGECGSQHRGEDARAIPARLDQKGTRPGPFSGASPHSLMITSYGKA